MTVPYTEAWAPPARPEWVAKINAEGSCLNLREVVPLDEQSLISTAVANTGLDDFGSDDWREPFHVLVEALNDEAQLNLMGRLMTRSDLLVTLQARLSIEAAYKAHPGIEDQQIIEPLVVIGQGRTGTTVLQNMLAASPDNRSVRHWEAMYPWQQPDPGDMAQSTVEHADRLVRQWSRVVPELDAKRLFDARVATESIHLHSLSFQSAPWFDVILGQTPSYAAYMSQRDVAEAYRYERRLLKLLQWSGGAKRWVMKSPVLMPYLRGVLDVYPDARFIWIHRDPVKALASVVSLIGTLHWMRSDEPFIGDTLKMYTDPSLAAGMLTQPIDWIEKGVLTKERLCHVQYNEFATKPRSVIDQIYSHFSLTPTDSGRAAMRRYIEVDNPRSARPAHAYDVGTRESISCGRDAFHLYQEYFNVPAEV